MPHAEDAGIADAGDCGYDAGIDVDYTELEGAGTGTHYCSLWIQGWRWLEVRSTWQADAVKTVQNVEWNCGIHHMRVLAVRQHNVARSRKSYSFVACSWEELATYPY